MRRIPINTDAEGNAKTIPAGYWKFRFRNLTRAMGGGDTFWTDITTKSSRGTCRSLSPRGLSGTTTIFLWKCMMKPIPIPQATKKGYIECPAS